MSKICLLPVLLLALASCEELVFDRSVGLPVIAIGGAEGVDESGVTLTAEIRNHTDQQIRESYFFWHPVGAEEFIENPRYREALSISGNGTVSVRIEHDIAAGVEYVYRLVIVLDETRVYSEKGTFTGKGSILNPFAVRDLGVYSHVNTSDFVEWYFEDIVANGNGNFAIFSFDSSRFEPVEVPHFGYLHETIFSVRPERLISAGTASRSGSEENGLWYLDDLRSSFRRVGDFPDFGLGIEFSFNTEHRCYYVSQGWEISSFDVENYSGVTKHEGIPFARNARRYHDLQVGDTGYVFFSNVSDNVDDNLHPNEFWSFDTQGRTWKKLPPFPGAGKDYFYFFTDQEKYIYVGMGIIGARRTFTDTRISEGDVWRYDIEDEQWDFIGWAPTRGGFIVDNRGSGIRNGKHQLFFSESGSKLLTIDPQLIHDIR